MRLLTEGWPKGVLIKSRKDEVSPIFGFFNQLINLLFLPHGH